jgi:hypothetical protein
MICGSLSSSGEAWALCEALRIVEEERRERLAGCGCISQNGYATMALLQVHCELTRHEAPNEN